MFGREKINDPYNTMGTSSSGMDDEDKRFVENLENAARTASGKESRKRISAYRAAVKGNCSRAGHGGSRNKDVAATYRSLTRSDCAHIWYPDCPESNDPGRRS
jgi:hypothetical protein